MKNIVLSAVAVLAMSSFAVAGGDIAPVEEPVVVVEPVITDGGFYLGLAYSLMNVDLSVTGEDLYGSYDQNLVDEDFNEIMLQAGYKFNSYVAVEGRYWFGLDSTVDALSSAVTGDAYDDTSFDAWGIYVKPMYPVTDAFDIYALLGYASTEMSHDVYAHRNNNIDRVTVKSDSLDGFSWGLGGAYSFTDNLAVFVDYVSVYDDSNNLADTANTWDNEADFTISTWNFGVTYQF